MIFYTCVVGGYDSLQPAPPNTGDQFICYSDDQRIRAPGWEVRPLPTNCPSHPLLANRYVKMHPHLLYPEADCSTYVDGNIVPKPGAGAHCQQWLAQGDWAVYQHPLRNTVTAEAEALTKLGLTWAWRLDRQLAGYRHRGFRDDVGLFECNVLIRRHHVAAVRNLGERWWYELSTGTVLRDQLSFPMVMQSQPDLRFVNMGRSDPRHDQIYFDMYFGHSKPYPQIYKLRSTVNAAFMMTKKPSQMTQSSSGLGRV